jgi:hypothetical protein
MDIVYTWVNGSDPTWQKKKSAAHRTFLDQSSFQESLEPYALVAGRYRDNQELRYSLRSLEAHFPTHGQVFLVTDGQCPEWLDTRQITLVDHSEIMSNPLPTFSSKRIESNLFKIPKLGKQWLYLNDDVFLAQQFEPTSYFQKDHVGVFFLKQERIGDFGEVLAASNAKKYLIGPWAGRQMAHAPRAVSRASYCMFVEEFADLHRQCQEEVFRLRQHPSLLSDLYGKWALQCGVGFEGQAQIGYIETHQMPTGIDLAAWSSEMSAFCINDTCDDNDQDVALSELRIALDRLYPTPSKFEAS